MPRKFVCLCFVVIILSLISCATQNEKNLIGKWTLASKIIGSSPQSYWFQKRGNVTAPWEKRDEALESSGTYKFLDDTHIKIIMKDGYYKGLTFFFQIVKVDGEELILRGSIQDIRMKRVEDI